MSSFEHTTRLTALSSSAGCAAKLSQKILAQVLRQIPQSRDRKILVGAGSFSDAGVYKLRRDFALVQTTDFFTPIVDDAYAYGQIAAANALSDVYAMGGRPVSALNIVAMPADKLPPETIRQILLGGADKTKEAGCALIGGHTIRNPEPIYGLAVTGIVDPRRMITNESARSGDVLLLTKPLGTGIATTAIRRGLASADLTARVIWNMKQLNSVGAELAEKKLVRTATDVTGFGLIGHLANICRASRVGAELDAEMVPLINDEIWALIEKDCIPGGTRANLEAANDIVEWNRVSDAYKTLLTDAQTSGGLLLCVTPKNRAAVERVLRARHVITSAPVGRIIASRRPRIGVA